MRAITVLAIVLAVLSAAAITKSAEYGNAVVIVIDGPIDAGAEHLVSRGVEEASARGWALVLEINTYGGYLVSADRIV